MDQGDGWFAVPSEEGPYYWNTITGATTLEKPRDGEFPLYVKPVVPETPQAGASTSAGRGNGWFPVVVMLLCCLMLGSAYFLYTNRNSIETIFNEATADGARRLSIF